MDGESTHLPRAIHDVLTDTLDPQTCIRRWLM